MLDQLVSLNSCRRRTNKWPLNIFMFMIDAATQNSYSLFKLQNNVPIDLYRVGLKIIFLNLILCLIFKLVNLKWRN
jgi:hypothetical protein